MDVTDERVATCELCGGLFVETRRRYFCDHCKRYFFLCPKCQLHHAKCTYCGVPLKKQTEPFHRKAVSK